MKTRCIHKLSQTYTLSQCPCASLGGHYCYQSLHLHPHMSLGTHRASLYITQGNMPTITSLHSSIVVLNYSSTISGHKSTCGLSPPNCICLSHAYICYKFPYVIPIHSVCQSVCVLSLCHIARCVPSFSPY